MSWILYQTRKNKVDTTGGLIEQTINRESLAGDVNSIEDIVSIVESLSDNFRVIRITKSEVEASKKLTLKLPEATLQTTLCLQSEFDSSARPIAVYDLGYSASACDEHRRKVAAKFTETQALDIVDAKSSSPKKAASVSLPPEDEVLPDIKKIRDSLKHISDIRPLPERIKPLPPAPQQAESALLKILRKGQALKAGESDIFAYLSLESSCWTIGTILRKASDAEVERLEGKNEAMR